ncbi:enoyl-CoA hydratase/isomerase family protein [Trypanosoma grayi]|uniref:enoyl-CoA hydratase/isomerase family protein n=1 Tax=Trypanosoma grayi TaxID=71804 RepID=UPI0004F419DB|nr:enoyl-CoA hydratase/isomerase family protein [Trypanosoma grayi]KEG15596.1 enoyl-CoA hydratase/isomerase family protein [Trypanosoma grayi]
MQRSYSLLSKALLWKDYPCARLVTINREKALNAMNLEMVKAMKQAYVHEPHTKGDAALYVLKGAGSKSFCSGGDIISVTKDNNIAKEFFYEEYQMDYHILTMPNPQVSLWNGYVMGGGVGVSIHGRYRVASERALFAMPETAIGLFPDIGASWFLPRLSFPGLGLYLGLTGARLKGADLAQVGLATHFVPSEHFERLEERLCNINDPAEVEACLAEFAVKKLPPFSLETHRKTLENVFTLKDTTTVEGILDALAADGSDFAKATIATINSMSPTSLCVALEMQKRGYKAKDPADIFHSDYSAALRSCANPDFAEGVRALLVDKTKDPKWKPTRVADVTPEYVEAYFKPVSPDSRQWHPTAPY